MKRGEAPFRKRYQGKQDKKERNEYISIETEMEEEEEEEELMKMQRSIGGLCGIQVDKSGF